MKNTRFIDYKLKSQVMKVNLHNEIKKIDYEDHVVYRAKYEDGLILKPKYDDLYVDLLLKYGGKWIKEARKINIASYRRIKRLKDRISLYLSKGTCIFVTLTFNDDVMNSTDEHERRVMVSRYLKSCSDCYVANIDYGADDKYTHREHYHALVLTDYITEKWIGGFTWFEIVHRTDSEKCLSKYISKLCNHAIKDSTKRACYIYSRG